MTTASGVSTSMNEGCILNRRNALRAGAHLWVISDLKTSGWARKINWYLNFQIYKFKKVKELSKAQIASLKDSGFEFTNISSKSSSLLISSEKLLTNKKTLVIEFSDINSWVEVAKKYWEGLNKPTLRFFTPDAVNVDELKSHLSDFNNHGRSLCVSVVEPYRV